MPLWKRYLSKEEGRKKSGRADPASCEKKEERGDEEEESAIVDSQDLEM
jgi:hypothetical protein